MKGIFELNGVFIAQSHSVQLQLSFRQERAQINRHIYSNRIRHEILTAEYDTNNEYYHLPSLCLSISLLTLLYLHS